MNWIPVLDSVISWLSSVFSFAISLYNRFSGYLAVILILTVCYFLTNKILLPVFDGHLPEGRNNTEIQRYRKYNNSSKAQGGD